MSRAWGMPNPSPFVARIMDQRDYRRFMPWAAMRNTRACRYCPRGQERPVLGYEDRRMTEQMRRWKREWQEEQDRLYDAIMYWQTQGDPWPKSPWHEEVMLAAMPSEDEIRHLALAVANATVHRGMCVVAFSEPLEPRFVDPSEWYLPDEALEPIIPDPEMVTCPLCREQQCDEGPMMKCEACGHAPMPYHSESGELLT